MATAVGAGDLADRSQPLEHCAALLRRALDAGLNVVDTAPNYENGYSEQIVARALHDRREGVFVVDKIDHLDRPVTPQVHESLGRLELAQADLFVFHDVSDPETWRRLASKGGAFDELAECVRAGKVRFRGISSHHVEVLREAIPSGLCDVVMLPVGPFVDPRYEEELLPLARSHGVGTISFKTFAAGMLVSDTAGYGRPLATPAADPLPTLTVEECVRYTLTRDPDVALFGMSTADEQDADLAAAAQFAPLTPEQLRDVRARAAEAVRARAGTVWWNRA
ncbi:MAG: aldo/keto reductase [Myxococcales bacterium]